MNNILIFIEDEEYTRHIVYVREVLERLREYNLYVKLSKYLFSVKQMEFLGFIIGVIGVTMDPRRVSIITEWPLPKSFHEIQQFIRFCNFFRRFIYAFSTIAKPLTDILKGIEKGKKSGLFELSVETEYAFRKL